MVVETTTKETTMIKVPDGSRTLQFDGALLASSTSWRAGAERWVEFSLYRTNSGTYIISRTGHSTLYHMPDCSVVRRNSLREQPRAALERVYAPCAQCRPDLDPAFPLVCPEQPRHKAQVCDAPEGVLETLYRYDNSGSRYLTLVAERLLEKAAAVDPELEAAWKTETII